MLAAITKDLSFEDGVKAAETVGFVSKLLPY
jgi:hypothetical protein